MPYDAVIERDDMQALMAEDVAALIEGVGESSAVMRLAKRLPPMSKKQRRIPVWETLPHAYFVNGDTGLKQTTQVSWDNVYLNAEEIAVIVPVPDAVLDDSDYPIFELAKPKLIEAVGRVFDMAVLYGTNAPAAWPDDLLTQIEAAGQTVQLGDVGDLYDDIMAEDGVLSQVEEDGFFVTGHLSALRMKAKMRGLREKDAAGNHTGQPIMVNDPTQKSSYSLDGEPLIFPRNGALDPAQSLMFSGDWDQLVTAIRQDITFKVLTEAVITNSQNEIIFNLAQQDMTALRLVFRAGWALPNPINRINENAATRFPFSALVPAGS